MTDRPIAEQLWADHIAATGDFPTLESLTDAEVETLLRVARATPANISAPVVSTWDGSPIYLRRMKAEIPWYRLNSPQHYRMLAVTHPGLVAEWLAAFERQSRT